MFCHSEASEITSSLTIWLDESAFEPRPDFGGNSGGGGTNLGEVQQSSSRPPWKVRA